MDFDTREVEVSCLPKDIVKEIEVDITELHSGQSIKIGSLDLGEKVTILTDEERVICSVTTKAAIVEEEVEEEIEEEGEEAAEEAEGEEAPSEEAKED